MSANNPWETSKTIKVFSFLILFSGLIFGISLSMAGYSNIFSIFLSVFIIGSAATLPAYLLSGGRL
ncbi:hypothetical protein [Methanosarcina siciliae]|uniref:hypothetical protein n=1 Tax=Methanosarcina siciliae TaxID=38027 RepID=UPI000A6BB19A|nr:hypothetical protein [Methanosarcina siciliae]